MSEKAGMPELAEKCREIVSRAQMELGANLWGFSTLDLVADQLPDVPLADLKAALVAAGIPHHFGSQR